MHQKHDPQPARSPISAAKCLSYSRKILERFLDIPEDQLWPWGANSEPLTLILAPLIDLVALIGQPRVVQQGAGNPTSGRYVSW